MSGPLTRDETSTAPVTTRHPAGPVLEITPSRAAMVDGQSVRRALPTRGRRTVGAWCFADHIGPSNVEGGHGLGIGPHPHIGLQTVTWLLAGEVLHRDSLGSEQLIRPGQLNLMTAGNGVAHAEESPAGASGELHGIQLWVAQPERTRHGAPAFEHHAVLPEASFDGGVATVLIGHFGGAESPARADTDHCGVDLYFAGGPAALALRTDYEYAMVVLDGEITVEEQPITPGNLAYLGLGRNALVVRASGPARVMLLGGVPFESPVMMFWNFVARTREEIEAATLSWRNNDGRFPPVNTELEPIPVPPTPWERQR